MSLAQRSTIFSVLRTGFLVDIFNCSRQFDKGETCTILSLFSEKETYYLFRYFVFIHFLQLIRRTSGRSDFP